mgnify:CR=1 FL=1
MGITQRRIYLGALLVITSALMLVALLYPTAAQLQPPLQAGDVAPADIAAPYALTFESQILTEAARADLAVTHGELLDKRAARGGEPQVRAVYDRHIREQVHHAW